MGMTLAELTQAILPNQLLSMHQVSSGSQIVLSTMPQNPLIVISSTNCKTMNCLQLNPKKPRFGTVGSGEFTIGNSKQMLGNLQEGQ